MHGSEDSVTCGVEIEENYMPRVLSAYHSAQPFHILQNISVPHFGRVVIKAIFLAGNAQAEIAHHGTDHQVVFQLALVFKHIGTDD